MANCGPHSMGARIWKCPLCNRIFSKEHDMDMHMITDCPGQNPVDMRGRAGSNSELSHRKKSTQQTGGNLTGKQSVVLTWEKEVNTCEREVFFFDKSGDMFKMTQQPPKQSSSLSLVNSSKFICKCELEVGEHEGSLNINDSGVHEISPFTINNHTKQIIVVLKLNHKAKSSQVKEQKPEAFTPSTTNKRTTNETARYQAELQTQQTKHAAAKKEYLQREGVFKQKITELKDKLDEKDKIIAFKNETVNNLEVELGRYSQRSQEMSDKLDEDKSKYERFGERLEGVRKELEQRNNEVVSLREEKQDMQEKYQEEMSNSKFRVESLNEECSLLKIELEKRSGDSKHGSATKSAETEEHLVSLTTRIRELEDALTAKDTYISQVYSELEHIRTHYSNLEKELESLKSVNQPSSRNEAHQFSSNSNNIMMSQFKTTIDELEMDLTLKRSECDDLHKKVTSLQSELKEAQDLLAYKLETPSKFGESLVESVHLSLPPGYTRKDFTCKNFQSADVDHVKIPKRQMEELEANTKYFKSETSRLQNLLESKETESTILRANLDESRKELENTKLLLHQTMSNPVKVQSKEDLQTGSDVREKQAQYSQVAAKHKQHPKYTITNLIVNGKKTPFYSLNQVDNPSDLIGELVVCRSKYGHNNVVGTLKVVIPPKLKFEKTIAGIEFVDKFGDSSGSYRGTSYFETKFGCALFLPTHEVYISYN